jgi:hypothetical protein
MSKVLGVHHVTLKDGVTGEALEQFFQSEYQALVAPISGLKVSLLKEDKGVRTGSYLVLLECDSVETRDRLFPSSGQPPEEAQPVFRLGDFASTEFTDYVEV